ncbi:MAG: electron transport complex subunit RsxC [Actinomycetota bacterium]|nr:electron transport complex subunit RsxC [Actinomycetota bacterium]
MSIIKKRSAFGGVKLPENKMTEEESIEVLPLPQQVVIPIQQNIGAPGEFLVKRGDTVLAGQKIADTDKFVSAPIHAPISGKVSKSTQVLNPASGAVVDALIIESDGQDQWVEMQVLHKIDDIKDWKQALSSMDNIPAKDALDKIREAGIVGLGGAAFPTHVKLAPPPDKKIDTFILNGCECEPFITSDHRVMLEYGKHVLAGMYLISNILKPEKIYIAIEDNKPDAIRHMHNLLVEMGLEDKADVVSLPSRYPMGAEKTLIKSLLGREVPMGGLPMDVGVVVNNVATCKAVAEAVLEGKPLTDKVITVTGAFQKPKNLLARIGTPISMLVDYCHLQDRDQYHIIMGGPMMGVAINDIEYPVTKGLNCVLIKQGVAGQEQNCIKCARCVAACPMGLMPLMYPKLVKKGRFEDCQEYYISNCIECGSCAFVCPANIPIVGYIKTGKKKISDKK